MTTLVATDLTAAYGPSTVLDRFGLTVPSGQVAAVLGPSGCGKSTFLRVVAGFHRPAAGQVRLGDRVFEAPGTHLPAQRRRVGWIPQDGALFPHLSVAGNVGFGLPRGRRHDRVAELLAITELTGFGRRRVDELSGGQQQRVALARALAPRPDLLLLDEPFSALDASLRTRVRRDVVDLLRTTGTTAVLVTHDAEEALDVSDLVAVIDHGRVAQYGSPADLWARPVSAAVAQAVGDGNVLPADVSGGVARTVLGALPCDGPGTHVLVRPAQLRCGSAGVAARVLSTAFRGDLIRLELAIGDTSLTADVPTDASIVTGASIRIDVRGTVHAMSG